MKVFISWSGDKSRAVANALHAWLPTVLAGHVECFISSQDIRRGDRGMDVIAGELQDRDFGIVVLTRENLESPWINFEAGALGKSLGTGKVAPLLLDVTRADVTGPLAQFQSTVLTDRDDFRQFIRDLAAHAPSLPDDSIDALFAQKWPELEAVIERAAGMSSPKTTRTAESMLEELLDVVRRIDREGVIRTTSRARTTWRSSIAGAITRAFAPAPGADDPSLQFRFASAANGDEVIYVTAPSEDTKFDHLFLQELAERRKVRIVVEPHNVFFQPVRSLADELNPNNA